MGSLLSMVRPLGIALFSLLLVGCAVREVTNNNTAPAQNDQNVLPQSDQKMFAFDPSNVSLAEKSAPLADFPKLLRAIGSNHAYHQWDETFINETMKEINSLAAGEAIESSFYTESDRGLEEVQVRLIRKDDKTAQARLTVSNPAVAKVLQSDMESL